MVRKNGSMLDYATGVSPSMTGKGSIFHGDIFFNIFELGYKYLKNKFSEN